MELFYNYNEEGFGFKEGEPWKLADNDFLNQNANEISSNLAFEDLFRVDGLNDEEVAQEIDEFSSLFKDETTNDNEKVDEVVEEVKETVELDPSFVQFSIPEVSNVDEDVGELKTNPSLDEILPSRYEVTPYQMEILGYFNSIPIPKIDLDQIELKKLRREKISSFVC